MLVLYQELDRAAYSFDGIFPYYEATHSYVNINSYQNKVNLTVANQPAVTWVNINLTASEGIDGYGH